MGIHKQLMQREEIRNPHLKFLILTNLVSRTLSKVVVAFSGQTFPSNLIMAQQQKQSAQDFLHREKEIQLFNQYQYIFFLKKCMPICSLIYIFHWESFDDWIIEEWGVRLEMCVDIHKNLTSPQPPIHVAYLTLSSFYSIHCPPIACFIASTHTHNKRRKKRRRKENSVIACLHRG